MKKSNINRKWRKDLRHTRSLNKIKREANTKPRLIVTKSNANIFAQLLDESSGSAKVIAACSSLQLKKPGTVAVAKEIGENIAKTAIEKGVTKIMFDRNGHKYHGQVKAVADGAREGGLTF